METTVSPERALEIENAFRAADTVGKFVDAMTEAVNASLPDYPALVTFTAGLNAAFEAALGGRDAKLNPFPEVVLLIEDYSSLTGTLLGILRRDQGMPASPRVIESEIITSHDLN